MSVSAVLRPVLQILDVSKEIALNIREEIVYVKEAVNAQKDTFAKAAPASSSGIKVMEFNMIMLGS